jgi:hypothetical protein
LALRDDDEIFFEYGMEIVWGGLMLCSQQAISVIKAQAENGVYGPNSKKL